MILPSKHLRPDRSLIGIGGELLAELSEARTTSELWERTRRTSSHNAGQLTFDWFVLALSFLYSIQAIDYSNGLIYTRPAR
jgi:hypothetical protein